MVLSGVNNNSNMSLISDAEMQKLLLKKFESRPSARLLCILLSCYVVPENDFKKMLASLKTNKTAVEAFRKLVNKSGSKFKRFAPVLNS